MNTPTAQTPSDPSKQPSPLSSPSAPYEAVLAKAFDKLSFQVFVFLLAYMILVIGLAVFAPQLATELRTLIYVLPVLGVGAYVWQRRRSNARDAREHGIDVKAGVVTGEVSATGVKVPKASG
jgi:hypothetical protein